MNKIFLTLALAFMFSLSAKAETLLFGNWNLTCEQAGCGGACYIQKNVSDDISISTTYYEGNLALNVYYTEKYFDVPISIIADDVVLPVEKRRQSSILKLKSDKLHLLHKAKTAKLVVGKEKFDLNIQDYQDAYNHWSSVTSL